MGRKVLLIEDEPNIIEALSYILSRDGWSVHVHSDGPTAAARVAERPPEVVILDVMLPGRSGFDILGDIRATPGLEALPVMMLTARGQQKDRARAEALGVTLYMTKPFDNAEIVAQVRTLAGPDRAA